MDLLTKFENVEMKADTRISEADRIFCEAQQAAYDNARTSLTELGLKCYNKVVTRVANKIY